jgi:uncharacterized protein with HEPN domain
MQSYDKQAFQADEKTQDAVVRQMEIIGEAATNFDTRFATAMRNRLVHGYFDVDASIVWDTTQNDLSPLKSQIEKILENLS